MSQPVPLLMLSLTLALGGMQWREGPPMPVPVGNHAAAFVDGNILVAGGTTWRNGHKLWLRDVWTCRPDADAWHRAGELPEPVGGAVGVAAGNALYVLGGGDGATASRHCYRLRLQGDELSLYRLPDLPEPRVYAAGARVGRWLCVVGGCLDPHALDTATDTLFALNLSRPEDGWRTLTPLPGRARVIHAAAGDLYSLYVFGGCFMDDAGKVRNLADAWLYDMSEDIWERLPDLPAANRGLTALSAGRHGILLFGGYTATVEEAAGRGDDFGFSAEVLRYSPDRPGYERAGMLPRAVVCATPVRCGDELAVLGGEPAMRQRSDRLWLNDLADMER
ncbi:MAG: hypothetical protein J7M38_09755 [Armatimonadetes bacterium]|nr:hypothetical protein [Armatimonadota bacterium]